MAKITTMRATKLDLLINDGVDLLRHLRTLEAKKKLTAEGFAHHARVEAELSEARAKKLQAKLERKTGVDACQRFLKRAAREFSTATYPIPPRAAKADRALRIYGEPAQIAGELAGLGILPVELVALAAMQSAEFYPQHFGTITDWTQHQIKAENARVALGVLYERMKSGWSAADIRVDRARDSDRERGLSRVVLVREPSLSIDMDDWPEKLVSAVLAKLDEHAETSKPKVKGKKRKRGDERSLAELAMPKAKKAKREEPRNVILSEVEKGYLR